MIKAITKILDLLYIKQLHRYVAKQTFYYAICGGSNMVMDMIIYALMYNFVLDKQDISVFGLFISSEIAAFLITFPIIYFTGLWLARNITFTNSVNSNRSQAFRYLTVTISNILIKYFGIKLLVYLAIWPSFANAAMTVVTVIFSYLMQKHFTFKGNKFSE